MKYYKDTEGNVYTYNDIQTPKDGLIEMTPEEVNAHINQPVEPYNKTQFSVLEFRDRICGRGYGGHKRLMMHWIVIGGGSLNQLG